MTRRSTHNRAIMSLWTAFLAFLARHSIDIGDLKCVHDAERERYADVEDVKKVMKRIGHDFEDFHETVTFGFVSGHQVWVQYTEFRSLQFTCRKSAAKSFCTDGYAKVIPQVLMLHVDDPDSCYQMKRCPELLIRNTAGNIKVLRLPHVLEYAYKRTLSTKDEKNEMRLGRHVAERGVASDGTVVIDDEGVEITIKKYVPAQYEDLVDAMADFFV